MWKKILLGCLVVGILGAITVGGLTYYFFSNFTGKTPEQVAQMAQEIAPGAQPPAGFSAGMGFELMGSKTASFEDKSTRRDLLVILVPLDPKYPIPRRDEVVPSLKESFNREAVKKGKTSSQESALEIRGFPCFKHLVTGPGQTQWEWALMAWGPTDHKQIVMITAHAPQDLPDNKFVQEFMSKIKLDPYLK